MQALVIRHWLRRHEVPPLPESRLTEFLRQLADASASGQVEVAWDDWRMKRYRETIWLQRKGSPPRCIEWPWNSGSQLNLGDELGRLLLDGGSAGPPPNWRVGPRSGGERIRARPGGPGRSLKQLFQECGIPPWMRASIPVLYWEDEAVALGDWVIAPRLQRWLAANGLRYRWRPAHPLLIKLQSDCHDFTVDPR